jgi:CheY-like chemotaxis protein
MDRPFAGRSILVVEDEPLIALELQLALEDMGATVHKAAALPAALALAEHTAFAEWDAMVVRGALCCAGVLFELVTLVAARTAAGGCWPVTILESSIFALVLVARLRCSSTLCWGADR